CARGGGLGDYFDYW
nr:immunoglobulin heavy chain junction region [Mus musculus]MBK4186419.1 immunoglobulin heavy chain junction region [Mus musculus]